MKGKSIKIFFSLLPKKAKRIYLRLPRGLRLVMGPLLGGLIGLLGGIAGLIIGLVLGYLIQELARQFGTDRKIYDYYENPGISDFYEGERGLADGLAAFCGLGIFIASKSSDTQSNADVAISETGRIAGFYFSPFADSATIEQFCRIAWAQKKNLNPDLLLESLVSRRTRGLDENESAAELSRLGAALYGIAITEKARVYAEELWRKLDPNYAPQNRSGESINDLRGHNDPWKILGISPLTPLPEVKSHFRKLAAQFHPDLLQGLDDEKKETATRAFIAIQEAYKEILSLSNSGSQ